MSFIKFEAPKTEAIQSAVEKVLKEEITARLQSVGEAIVEDVISETVARISVRLDTVSDYRGVTNNICIEVQDKAVEEKEGG